MPELIIEKENQKSIKRKNDKTITLLNNMKQLREGNLILIILLISVIMSFFIPCIFNMG